MPARRDGGIDHTSVLRMDSVHDFLLVSLSNDIFQGVHCVCRRASLIFVRLQHRHQDKFRPLVALYPLNSRGMRKDSNVEMSPVPRELSAPLLDDDDDQSDGTSGSHHRVLIGGGGGENGFCNNSISTTKYTVLNVLPKTTCEQFRRLANVYFLGTSALMLLAYLKVNVFESSLNPFTTLGPLVIIVLMTDIKQALEDWKRHKSDMLVNNRKTTVMGSHSGPSPATDRQRNSWAADYNADSFHVRETQWKNVRVGELVRIQDKEPFPADVILLASSTDNGLGECSCFIETASIDGETNLKLREAVALPTGIFVQPTGDQASFSVNETFVVEKLKKKLCGSLTFEPPNPSLHTFAGSLSIMLAPGETKTTVPVGPENIMLRGSTLQNTGWVWALVVYTGNDTKLMQNAQSVPSKQSKMDLLVNRCILMIISFQIILTVVSLFGGMYFNRNAPFVNATTCSSDRCDLPSYLGKSERRLVFGDDVGLFLTFLVLFNNVVPISLYVTMEVVSYIQGHLIENDVEMYHEDTDTPALARTSNLIGDLGQVQWIFSDKTGTLTCNEMHLRQCFVGGRMYGALDANGTFADDDCAKLMKQFKASGNQSALAVSKFFRALAVCHTVVAELSDDTPSRITYRAESPDEAALVDAAAAMGMRFITRTSAELRVQLPDGMNQEIYALLAVNEFNSTRKRMSVLVREKRTGKVKLICKGADNVIFDRAHKSVNTTPAGPFAGALTAFAKLGLRTLVIAEREVPEGECKSWLTAYTAARMSISNRGEKLAAVAEKIERDLRILGITAIEDRLQDGVPGTISDLARAGIKLWVLTGDKQETAINIGYSCKLLTEDTAVVKIDGTTSVEVGTQMAKLCNTFGAISKKKNLLEKAFDQLTGAAHMVASTLIAVPATMIHGAVPRGLESGQSTALGGRLALVVPGHSLEFILDNPLRTKQFVDLGKLCDALIACRVSPSQKAKLVRAVRKYANEGKEEPMTLAIGDGANDVGMILEAHLGIGISGKEGMQAVNNSDFAIAQFRFLRQLLLIHGRWSYLRAATVFLYSFYKNIVLVFTLFYFLFDSGFSGTSLFESWLYAGYNFYLGWPIIGVGFLNQDISCATVLKFPELYATGRLNMSLSVEKMFEWLVMGFIYSFVIFFVAVELDTPARYPVIFGTSNGQAEGFAVFGTRVNVCLVAAMQIKVMRETSTVTWITLFFQAISWILYFVSILVMDYIPGLLGTYEMEGVFVAVFGSPGTYMYVLLVLAALEVVEKAKDHLRLQYRPNAIDITKEMDHSLATGSRTPHATKVAERSVAKLNERRNSFDISALEGVDDIIAAGNVDVLRPHSSFAYDHPSFIGRTEKMSISSRRSSFGHISPPGHTKTNTF